jgi:FkbM family methyltransferase
MLKITNIISGKEFGTDICRNIWTSMILKKKFGDLIHIKSKGKWDFPKEIWTQFTDEYIVEKISHQECISRKLLKQLNNRLSQEDYHAKFDWTWVTPTDRKYVCFIPLLAERWTPTEEIPMDKKSTAGGRSLPFSDWVDLKNLANSFGYDVIVLGDMKHTGIKRVDWSQLGDEFFFIQEFDGPPNKYFSEQLKIMANAKFTIGMGGGGTVAPAFGLPGIQVDENWHYSEFDKTHGVELRDDLDVLFQFPKNSNNKEIFNLTKQFCVDAFERRLSNKKKLFIDCGCNKGSIVMDFLKESPKYFEPRTDRNEFEIHAFDYKQHENWNKIKSEKIHFYEKLIWTENTKISFKHNNFSESNHIEPITYRNHTKNFDIDSYPAIDLCEWIETNFNKDDYIVLKMDIEGSEYEVLRKLISTGIIYWIDELYVEFHVRFMSHEKDWHKQLLKEILPSMDHMKFKQWH